MICALCLAQGRPLVEDPDPKFRLRPAGAAITVMNGEALCLEHLGLAP